MSLLKRKRSESSGTRKQLTSDEQTVYNAIKSKTNMGISKMDLKRELNMRDKVFNGCIKTLKEKAKIKEVKSVKSKWAHLMAVEFEPSNVVTGGLWYSDGKLDTEFVENLTKISLAFIRREKVATAEQAREMVMASKAFNGEMSVDQIKEILETLVLDKEVMKVKSTGSGEYASVPTGTVCYRIIPKVQQRRGDMVSVPCGVCPRINQCTPDGVISPTTCEYYKKWLDF